MTAPSEDRRIAIACDHAGYELKEEIKNTLLEENYEVLDLGTNSSQSVDYPDYAAKVAEKVSKGVTPFGILICGTGIGVSMTANKFSGVRAALATNTFMASASRQHNNANILCLGSRVTDKSLALEMVKTWLGEDFEGGRHERRVEKIHALEKIS